MAPTMSLSRSALKNVHLPYMVQYPEPTDYSTAMKQAVEGYDRARQMIAFLFDILDYESSVPQKFTLEEKREKYTWSRSDGFPPHLAIIPEGVAVPSYVIFSPVRLAQTLSILSGIQSNDRLAPGPEQNTMEKLTKWNAERHKNQGGIKNMYNEPNIGLRDDWYTDAVFAQQFFTGTNPTTITLASDTWMKAFTEEAMSQGKRDVISLFRSAPPNSFYVQDFSDFRARMGAKPDEELCASSDGGVKRYACAAVALFYLPPTGELHPLAIIPDYKGSMTASITLFNKRVDPSDASVDQANDWPWRYAKTCVLSADWVLHEMIIHLNNTHLVEEAVIVAVQRTLPDSHIVFRLLEPHWVVTLSLNAQARSVLVPEVVVPVAGFSEPRILQFVGQAFTNFDWKALYVPTDLESRGFPLDRLDDDKFHNYAYARDIKDMWMALRKFVSSVLRDGKYYPDNSAVAADTQIQDWCDEMRSEKGAGMKKFPESISTLDDLIDMVTMCIHIAAPQHTAVNYLQQYYQTFVPNKPSALFSPLPTLLSQLESYTESDLMAALPLGAKQDWLLMAQVPYLLSKEVEQDGNIVTYAGTASNNEDPIIAAAGKELSADLDILAGVFLKNSEKLDDQNTAYNVLAPDQLANAIVI